MAVVFDDDNSSVRVQSRSLASALKTSLRYIPLRAHGALPLQISTTNIDRAILANFVNDDERKRESGSASLEPPADFAPDVSYASALSEPSPFGFHVLSMTPLMLLQATNQRNWTGFFVVTCLLTAATLSPIGRCFGDMRARAAKGRRNCTYRQEILRDVIEAFEAKELPQPTPQSAARKASTRGDFARR